MHLEGSIARRRAGDGTAPLNANTITDALVNTFTLMSRGLGPSAFLRHAGAATLLVSGVQFPTMNGVITVRSTVASQDVDELLGDAALETIMHSAQLRPGCSRDVVGVVERHGLHEDEPIPLMAMAGPTQTLHEAARHSHLAIRTLEPDEARLHASIAAAGFGVPVEVMDAFATPAVLALPGFRAYVGSMDGAPVTTALSVRGDDYVGIFDVATPEDHRGKGFGAAVTAKATLDGFESGASFAFLQSSEMGLGVYQRLGFVTLETWSVWVSGPPSRS